MCGESLVSLQWLWMTGISSSAWVAQHSRGRQGFGNAGISQFCVSPTAMRVQLRWTQGAVAFSMNKIWEFAPFREMKAICHP